MRLWILPLLLVLSLGCAAAPPRPEPLPSPEPGTPEEDAEPEVELKEPAAPKAAGDDDDVEAETTPAVDIDTADDDSDLTRAVRLFETDELTQAAELLAAYREAHPQSAEAAYHQGRVDFARKRYAAAVAAFEQAIALDDEYVDAYLRLGEALAEQIHLVLIVRKLPMAKRIHEAFLRAAELDPDSIGAHTALARFYAEAPDFAGGDREQALHHARELIRLDPREGHLLLSSIYERFEEPALAAQELAAAIQADPEHAATYRQAGALYSKLEQYDTALSLLERALALEPDDPETLAAVGRVALRVADTTLGRAEASLQAYLDSEPAPAATAVADARWRLGQVYERQGDLEGALREYGLALALEPEHEEALAAQAALEQCIRAVVDGAPRSDLDPILD